MEGWLHHQQIKTVTHTLLTGFLMSFPRSRCGGLRQPAETGPRPAPRTGRLTSAHTQAEGRVEREGQQHKATNSCCTTLNSANSRSTGSAGVHIGTLGAESDRVSFKTVLTVISSRCCINKCGRKEQRSLPSPTATTCFQFCSWVFFLLQVSDRVKQTSPLRFKELPGCTACQTRASETADPQSRSLRNDIHGWKRRLRWLSRRHDRL